MLVARQAVSSPGGKTPGIDGKVFENSIDSYIEIAIKPREVTDFPKTYKASPVKRVMVPKGPGSTEKRPLGIPTIFDRAVQALYLYRLLPIAELRADKGSFGFRKGMGTRDASIALKNAMVKVPRPQLIFDADISKFFDNVSHSWLIENVPMDKDILRAILTSEAMVNGVIEATEKGFPQGGIISPMLGNLTLDGLERVVKEPFLKYKGILPKVNVIRYADDFIITGPSLRWCFDDTIVPNCTKFLKERGLNIHPVKSRIIDPYVDSFDFLGSQYK